MKPSLYNSAAPIRFAGGDSGDKPVRIPDTLRSDDTIEAILGLGEGPWKGLKNGPRSFYTDETPVANSDGRSNISNFELEFFPGSALGETIKPRMGGFAASRDVAVQLSQNVNVVRQTVQQNIDYLEIRFVISQLFDQKDDGAYPADLKIKVEYKRSNSATWLPAYNATEIPPLDPVTPPTGGAMLWTVGADELVIEGAGERALSQPSAPSADFGLAGGVWFDSDNSYLPHFYQGGSWQVAPGLTTNGNTHTYLDPFTNTQESVTWQAPETPTPDPREIANGFLILFGFPPVHSNQTSWTASNGDIEVSVSGVISFKEKITQRTVKEIRFPVENVAGLYDIRITKMSPDAGTQRQEVVHWESFQEVKATPMVFPNTSSIRFLTKASDHFSRVPTLQGEYECLIVNVPSNYDPVARTYTGAWDGTWKKEYTNNPFWCLNDFIENDRYGISRMYPQTMSKASLYNAARWADEEITNPDGSKRPRWTFNEIIYEAKNAKEFANYIAGSACSRIVDDGNGSIEVLVDRDTPAVALFGLHNVTPDGFSYTYTEPQTRANDILVRFKNPALFWARDARRVVDDADIALNGRRTAEIYAVGCIDPNEAVSRGMYRLLTGITEKEMVRFKTQRKGFYCRPYEIILVADPYQGYGIGRRVKSKLAANRIQLRDSVALEEGVEYVATFDIPNPDYPATSDARFKTIRNKITSNAGTLFELEFEDALPAELADEAHFVIEGAEDIGTPKPYRIIQIESPEGDPDNVQIVALEVNRNKWPIIEGHIPPSTGTIVYSRPFTETTQPVENLKFTTEIREFQTQAIRVGILSWDHPEAVWAKRYRITHRLNGGTPTDLGTINQRSFEFHGLMPGRHQFDVVAVDPFNGRESPARSIIHDVSGELRYVPAPTSVVIVNGTGLNFNNLDAQFGWAHSELNPEFSHFEVSIINTSTNLVTRAENVGNALEWYYSFDMQQADGLKRSFHFEVKAVDQLGNESAPVRLTVSNPVPAKPTAIIEQGVGGVTVRASAPPTDGDIAGMYVWVSTTNNFNPQVVAPTYDTDQTSVWVPRPNMSTVYARIAFYDRWGKTVSTLNISDQVSGVPRAVLPDEVPQLSMDKIINLNTTVAGLQSQYNALDTEVDGVAASLTTLQSTVGDHTAAIATLETAVANGNGAIADRVTVVEASLGHAYTLTLTPTTMASPAARSLRKASGATAWDAQGYSNEGHTGGAFASFRPAQINAALMAGLNSNADRTNASYTGLDYAWYCKADGTLAIYESNVQVVANAGTYSVGMALAVHYDGAMVRYFRNGALVREVAATAGVTYYFDSSFNTVNGRIDDIIFGPSNIQAASVTQTANAVATVEGRIEATAGLTVNANGRVAGMRLHAVDGTEVAYTQIDFLADRFRIFNGTTDTGVAPFQVVDNQVRIDNALIRSLNATNIAASSITAGLIQAGAINSTHIQAGTVSASHIAAGAINASHISADSITGAHIQAGAISGDSITVGTITADRLTLGGVTTDRIANEAVTKVASAFTSDTINVNSTQAVVQTVVMTTTGGPLFVLAQAWGTQDMQVEIWRDGAVIYTVPVAMLVGNDSTPYRYAGLAAQLIDTPPAGVHSYEFRLKRRTQGSNIPVYARNLVIMELKR